MDRTVLDAPPSRKAMRKLLGAVLVTDSDLESFCIDHFPEIQRRFSSGMDRLSKTNLLLELGDPADILMHLREHDVQAVSRHAAILQQDGRHARHVQALALRLEILFEQKEGLASRGQDSAAIDAEILTVRRQQRQGPQLEEGELLGGRYKLLEVIGRGGIASVWQAYDRKRQQLVAIKVLHGQWTQDLSMLARFERGARKMAALSHPHIVRVLAEPAEDQGFHYLVMEYLPGGDLGRAIREGRLRNEAAMSAVLQVGEALHHAHEHGFIHRDVKPANILLDGNQAARLTDFDLVMGADTTGGTRTGALGTFLFAAPEALEDARHVDRRADVYSLGMTVLYALHGKDLPSRILENRQKFIAELACSASQKAVLRRALAWEPEERFSTIAELCHALRSALNDASPESPIHESVKPPEIDSRHSARTPSVKYVDPHRWIAGEGPMPDSFRVSSNIHFPPPLGYLSISLGNSINGDWIYVKVSNEMNLQTLLNSLYSDYLSETYKAYTYGTDWVLIEEITNRLAVDWRHLQPVGRRNPSEGHNYVFDRIWSEATPLSACGLVPGSWWRVTPTFYAAFGVCTNEQKIFDIALNHKYKLHLLEEQGLLISAESMKIDPDDYKFVGIFRLNAGDIGVAEGQAFIQPEVLITPGPISEMIKQVLDS